MFKIDAEMIHEARREFVRTEQESRPLHKLDGTSLAAGFNGGVVWRDANPPPLPADVAKLRDDLASAYEFVTGPVGFRNGFDAALAFRDDRVRKLVEAMEYAHEALLNALNDTQRFQENRCIPTQDEVNQLGDAELSVRKALREFRVER